MKTPAHIGIAAIVLSALYSCSVKMDTAGPVEPPDTDSIPEDAAILAMVRKDIQNTAYYKDLFLDGCCNLNPGIKVNGAISNGTLPHVIEDIGYSCEYILSVNDDPFDTPYDGDKERLQQCFGGTDKDINGTLLYPDGEPRFRLLYFFGGSSSKHGTAIGPAGRTNIRQFYRNGGSVTGSCAGAFLIGRYASGASRDYLDIVTNANTVSTGLSNSSTEVILTKDSPLLDYYDFGPDKTIDNVRHNGGGFLDISSAPTGTEVLATFGHSPKGGKEAFYEKPNAWAYKESAETGRVAVTGSHPEDGTEGNLLHFSESLFQYAYDGSGIAKVKGVLHYGEPRDMIYSHDPAYCPIGDLQCHHFVIWVPSDNRTVTVSLFSYGDYNMQVFMKKDNFAFPENNPDFKSEGGLEEQTIVAENITAGLWYIAVKCKTTVKSEEKFTRVSTKQGRYFEYSGITDILNGAPYTIEASLAAKQ